jgi:gluconolactonase
MPVIETLVDRLDHPEGVCWDPVAQVLWAGGEAGQVVAKDPQGTLLGAPTNVAFAGAQLDRLVCANLGRWHLALVESGLRGIPLHYPDTWAADA